MNSRADDRPASTASESANVPVGSPPRATPWRTSAARRVARTFTIAVVLVAFAYAVRFALSDRTNAIPHAAVALILGGASIALAWLAVAIARGMRPGFVRHLLVLVVAYHALFGPALMLQRLFDPVSRNDDLVPRAWPHVVHAIDSLE